MNADSALPLGFTLDAPKAVPGLPPGFTLDPPNAGRSLALGARNVIEGLTALPGMAYDAAALPINAAVGGFNALTGASIPQARPFAEQRAQALDAAGLPKAETAEDRIAARVIQEVSGLLTTGGIGKALQGAGGITARVGAALNAQPVAQIVGAAGSGLAGGAAHEAGADPLAEAGASLAGGIGGAALTAGAQAAGRLANAAREPFFQGPRERIAAQTILQSSSDPETLPARLSAGLADDTRRLPGSPVTTAQAAVDPGLMVLEQGARGDAIKLPGQGGATAAATLRDMDAQRNANRLAGLRALDKTAGQSPEGAGIAVRGALRESERETSDKVGALYRSIEENGEAAIPSKPFATAAVRAANEKYGPGSGGRPEQLEKVYQELDALRTDPAPMSVEFLQNMRARLGNIAGQAAARGDKTLSSTAREMRAAIDTVAEDAATMREGITPRQFAKWQEAIAARRDMGERFGRDETGTAVVGQILRKDSFGRPMAADARVANMALASPDSVAQTLAAAGPRSREVREALQGQFARNLLDASLTTGTVADAAGNASRQVGGAGFVRFMDDNAAVAKWLFLPKELSRLKQIAADFTETMTATTTARARGSDTAQNLSVGNMIARASNGLIDPTNPMAQTVTGLGPVMRLIYQAPEAATREIIVQAIADPKFAEALLARATPAAVDRAAFYLNKTLPDRLAEAARDAAVRQGARSANALATQAQQ